MGGLSKLMGAAMWGMSALGGGVQALSTQDGAHSTALQQQVRVGGGRGSRGQKGLEATAGDQMWASETGTISHIHGKGGI